jgi:outer membrane autotransporter protein
VNNDLRRRTRRALLCTSTTSSLLAIVFAATPAFAQNITYTGPGDYSLSSDAPLFGGPRAVDITVTSGNVTLDLDSVSTTNPAGGTYAYPGTAIGVANQGAGTVAITSGFIAANGPNQSYGIDARSTAGAISITSGTIDAVSGNIFATGRGISAISVSGPVTINSDTINTDSPTGIFAQGAGVNVTSATIRIGGDSDYSFDPTAAIYAKDTGQGISVASGSIVGTGTVLSGVLVNGTGTTQIDSNTIQLSGLYARGIASFGSGDVSIHSGTIIVDGYGAVGISADARLGGSVDISSELISAGAFTSGIRVTGGMGVTSITSGAISSNGDFATAIAVDGGSGAISISSGSITTDGYFASGIDVSRFSYSPTESVTINSDAIATNGGASNGIAAEVSGPLVINSKTLVTRGDSSAGISAASGSGSIRITSGQLITLGAASGGIVADARDGDLTIVAGTTATAGDSAAAINATASGALSITADQTATTGSSATGIGASGENVVIAAKSVSTSGARADGIRANGTNVSINAGTVNSTGAGVVASASESVFVTVDSVSTSAAETNSNVGPLGNSPQNAIEVRSLGAANVTVNKSVANVFGPTVAVNAGTTATFTLGSQGVLDAGTQVTLSGVSGETFVNNGTVNGNGSTPVVAAVPGLPIYVPGPNVSGPFGWYPGSYTIVYPDAGPLTFVNNGVFGGVIGFSAANDTVVNNGTYRVLFSQDFGAGFDTFTNHGVLAVLSAATTASTVRMTGLEQFTNAGLIDLRNGHAGDVLSLSGNFNGVAGSTLAVDITPTENGTYIADRLAIGGAATGSTRIIFNQARWAALNPGTIFATGGAGSTSTAFVIAPDMVERGLLHYGVRFDNGAGNYSLVVTPGDAVIRMLKVNEGAQQLWYRGGDAWSSHMQELRMGGSSRGRLWGQMIGETNSRRTTQSVTDYGVSRDVNLSYNQDNFGGQLGFDLVAPSGGEGVTAGVMAGYFNSTLAFRHAASRAKYDSADAAVYLGVTSHAFFANLLAQYNHLWIDLRDSAAGYSDRLSGNSYGVQGEIGFRIQGGRLVAEPLVSLAYVRTDIGDIAAFGQNVALDAMDGLRGKAGLRLTHRVQLAPATTLNLYIQPNYVREFKGNAGLAFSTGAISLHYANRRLPDYAEGKIGVGIGSGGISGFFEGFGNIGHAYRGGGVRAGLRLGF